MSNFESSVKVIPYSQERVYNKLSDLSNLEAVKDRLPKDKVQDLSFDSDTLSFSVSPIGKLTLQIVERDPCKCIKLATTNSPLPFNMWIQLVETAEEECKVKVTIGMDLNPFMKAMVQKPLQEGLEKMVDMLAVTDRIAPLPKHLIINPSPQNPKGGLNIRIYHFNLDEKILKYSGHWRI